MSFEMPNLQFYWSLEQLIAVQRRRQTIIRGIECAFKLAYKGGFMDDDLLKTSVRLFIYVWTDESANRLRTRRLFAATSS